MDFEKLLNNYNEYSIKQILNIKINNDLIYFLDLNNLDLSYLSNLSAINGFIINNVLENVIKNENDYLSYLISELYLFISNDCFLRYSLFNNEYKTINKNLEIE